MAEAHNIENDNYADKIKHLLDCSVCSQRFKNPKCLPCHHTFCKTCLETLSGNGNNIQCPECRALHILSSDDVSGLSTNFTMVSLIDISPVINDHENDQKLAQCAECATESIQSDLTACPHCGDVICPVCSVSHFTDLKASLYNSAHLIYDDVARIYDARHKLETDLRQLKKKGENVKTEINKNVDKFIHELRDRQKTLCQQVDVYVSNLSSLLQSEMTRLEPKLAKRLKISASIDSAIAKLHSNIEADMETLVSISTQCSEFIDQDKENLPSSLQNRTDHSVNFVSINMEILTESILKFGEITTETREENICSGTPDIAMLTTPRNAYSERQGRVFIDGNQSDGFSVPLCIAISPSGNRIYVTVDNTVQIYDERGRHIKTSRGPHGWVGGFNIPTGIAVNKYCEIIVADSRNHRIVVLNRAGECRFSFGKHGKSDGQFDLPWGVAVDDACTMYVCDSYNHRIQAFNLNGGYMRKFVQPASVPGIFYPVHLTIAQNTDCVYVTDGHNHRVLVYSTLGEYITCFGTHGSADGEMRFPCGICVDDNGHVIIADYDNHCVQVFQADGTFQCTLGGHVTQNKQLSNPGGLAIDNAGRLFVVGFPNKRVIAF